MSYFDYRNPLLDRVSGIDRIIERERELRRLIDPMKGLTDFARNAIDEADRLTQQIASLHGTSVTGYMNEANSAVAAARLATGYAGANDSLQARVGDFRKSIGHIELEKIAEAQKYVSSAAAIARFDDAAREIAHAYGIHDSLKARIDEMPRAHAEFEARFYLASSYEMNEISFRFEEMQRKSALYSITSDELRSAATKFTTPWLDAQNAARSLDGFAALQDLGHMMKSLPASDDRLTAFARDCLGDWRDPIALSPGLYSDPGARLDLYADRGFNDALTDFPAAAFMQSLDMAGLRPAIPDVKPGHGVYVPRKQAVIVTDDEDDTDEIEYGFSLNNEAHDVIQRFEYHFRMFVDRLMTEAYGPNWAKHRLPNGMYDSWVETRDDSVKQGRPAFALIFYADFRDYEKFITRKDNWNEVFATFFKRPENVRESFQRLSPCRNETSHTRFIMPPDIEIVRYETTHLLRMTKIVR